MLTHLLRPRTEKDDPRYDKRKAEYLLESFVELHPHAIARQCFSAGSGGSETYTGKDMRTAHKGMNISEQECLAVMDDTVGAMEKNGLSKDTKTDVIAILYSLEGDIIRV